MGDAARVPAQTAAVVTFSTARDRDPHVGAGAFGDSGPRALSQPYGVAVDRAGHVWVADRAAERLRGYLSRQGVPETGHAGTIEQRRPDVGQLLPVCLRQVEDGRGGEPVDAIQLVF